MGCTPEGMPGTVQWTVRERRLPTGEYMPDEILVPVEGSPEAERAIDVGVPPARLLSCEVVLLWSWEDVSRVDRAVARGTGREAIDAEMYERDVWDHKMQQHWRPPQPASGEPHRRSVGTRGCETGRIDSDPGTSGCAQAQGPRAYGARLDGYTSTVRHEC